MEGIYLLVVLFCSGVQINSAQTATCAMPNLGTTCSTAGQMLAISCDTTAFYYCSGSTYILGHCAAGAQFTNGKCVGGSTTNTTTACSSTVITADTTNCQNYIQCVNGQSVTKTCTSGLYFNPVVQGCTPTKPSTCNTNVTGSCTSNQVTADPNNCQNYIQCVNGQSYTKSCPNGLYFNAIVQGCTPTRPNTCSNGNGNTGTCYGNQITADPSNCQSYIQCVNGQYYRQSCPNGLYYNQNVQGCTPTMPLTCNGNGNQGGTCIGNQILADFNNCQNYIQCVNGQAYTQSCPNGLYYNPIVQGCSSMMPASCNQNNQFGNCYQNNQMMADSYDCQRYYVCVNGRQMSATCPSNYFFYPQEQSCGPNLPASCGGNSVLVGGYCSGNDIIADSYNCQKYYVCVYGQQMAAVCEYGRFFNPQTKKCGTYIPPSCTNRYNNMATCPMWGNTIIANPNNCQSYISCVNGQAQSYSCPNNMYYNPIVQGCSENVPATCNAVGSIGVTCPSNASINIPDMGNCQNYYLCYGGQSYSMSCENGLYYDIESASCMSMVPMRCNGFI